jgi:site-specific recombinase XerD
VDRTLPLHPAAEDALRAIMIERPKDERRLDAWRATPIFRSLDGDAWDRHSYRKPWKALMVAVATEFPRLSGMVLRDLRTAASTTMRSSGVDGAIAAKILGHSEGMNAKAYTVATDESSRRAILSL